MGEIDMYTMNMSADDIQRAGMNDIQQSYKDNININEGKYRDGS